MTFRIKGVSIAALVIAISASAGSAQTVTKHSVFATGGPVGGTGPDSVTTGDGSVWVEYGNSGVSTGAVARATIVQYSFGGVVQHVYSISGLVDGLKFNPVTGMIWALQNNDANSTLSLINPTTHAVSGPLKYAARHTSMEQTQLAPRRSTTAAAMTTSRSSMAVSISATPIR